MFSLVEFNKKYCSRQLAYLTPHVSFKENFLVLLLEFPYINLQLKNNIFKGISNDEVKLYRQATKTSNFYNYLLILMLNFKCDITQNLLMKITSKTITDKEKEIDFEMIQSINKYEIFNDCNNKGTRQQNNTTFFFKFIKKSLQVKF